MGTYTTNYNLFMPTVGETGWGELVNGNFETIDAELKSLSNKLVSTVAAINYKVTPDTTTYFYTNSINNPNYNDPPYFSITVLPRIYGVTYTGSIKLVVGNSNNWCRYTWSAQNTGGTGVAGSTITCSFTDAPYFMCAFGGNDNPATSITKVYGFTLEPNVIT